MILIKPCNRCKNILTVDHFDKNGSGYYSICKRCKAVTTACRRYDLSSEQVEGLYKKEDCECCGKRFTDTRLRHIHHVDTWINGIICQSCNHVLGQETQEDLERILFCINYIQNTRKNLFNRDNPQGRYSVSPQRLTRPTHTLKVCKYCCVDLPLSRKLNYCSKCASALTASRKYGIAIEDVLTLRSKIVCDCCVARFTRKNFACIHHTDDQVKGIVCNNCNRLLGNESKARLGQLFKCANWIEAMMMI
jgi:hypothetical protein